MSDDIAKAGCVAGSAAVGALAAIYSHSTWDAMTAAQRGLARAGMVHEAFRSLFGGEVILNRDEFECFTKAMLGIMERAHGDFVRTDGG